MKSTRHYLGDGISVRPWEEGGIELEASERRIYLDRSVLRELIEYLRTDAELTTLLPREPKR